MNDYERIAKLIQYLDAHHAEQPTLAELASQLDLSPFHFHRLFSKWAGITPKDFLQCLTLEHAKSLLRSGESVLGASLESGLSSPGRLHDLCIQLEAATPGELKSGGSGWTITLGFAETPFGAALIAESPRGICHLSFGRFANRHLAEQAVAHDFPRARLHWSDAAASRLAAAIFNEPLTASSQSPLRLFVRGTPFQIRVWRALLQIPSGALTSYGRIAGSIGNPAASRAVGSAIGSNEIAYLIPCHRVIRGTGMFGDYRWGAARKRAMIAWESVRH